MNDTHIGHSFFIALKLCNISWKNADYRMCQCRLKKNTFLFNAHRVRTGPNLTLKN